VATYRTGRETSEESTISLSIDGVRIDADTSHNAQQLLLDQHAPQASEAHKHTKKAFLGSSRGACVTRASMFGDQRSVDRRIPLRHKPN
jgi:hypothetical protein